MWHFIIIIRVENLRNDFHFECVSLSSANENVHDNYVAENHSNVPISTYLIGIQWKFCLQYNIISWVIFGVSPCLNGIATIFEVRYSLLPNDGIRI